MNKISSLEVFFEGVPPQKENLAAHFTGMAQAALTEFPNDPHTGELVANYLARAARALGENCVVALAQGAAGATAIRQITTSYQGSLGQEIKVNEVVAHAAPVIHRDWEDRSHQVVFAKGLHSPEAREAIDAHARHLAAEQGFGRREEVEYNPGVWGLVQRVVNAVADKPVLGITSVTTDQGEFQQASQDLAARIRYAEGQRLVEQVNPAPVSPEAVKAEIAAARQRQDKQNYKDWQDIQRAYSPGGPRYEKCLLDP